jgi:hypothetical protein
MKHQLVACPNCGFRRTIHAKDPAGKHRAPTGGSVPINERRPGVKVTVRRKKVLHARAPSSDLHSRQDNGE